MKYVSNMKPTLDRTEGMPPNCLVVKGADVGVLQTNDRSQSTALVTSWRQSAGQR